MVLGGMFVILLLTDGHPEQVHGVVVLLVFGWLILYLGFLVPGRLRDLGWSNWLILLCLIPLVNLALLILLLTKPSKKTL